MSALACCFWWFLAGLLLGWLLNWLLSKLMGKDSSGGGSSSGTNTYNASSQASNGYSVGTVSGAAGTALAGAAAAGAGTAKALMPGGADVALAAAAGFKLKGANDLEVIEGIGPKIAGLFNENGVTTFAQVSGMSVPAMNAILEKGGSRFKLANPGTWAEQARLCYENRWSELQALQDSLSAGVDKS
jgi:predicted flap endonuclease-1-like 5' DNA nuclease